MAKQKGYTIDDKLVNDLNQYGKGKKAPKGPAPKPFPGPIVEPKKKRS